MTDSKIILCVFGVLLLLGTFFFLYLSLSSHDARLEVEAKRKAELEERDRQEEHDRRAALTPRAEASRKQREEQAIARSAEEARKLQARVEIERKRAEDRKNQRAEDLRKQQESLSKDNPADALAKEEARLDGEQTSAVSHALAKEEARLDGEQTSAVSQTHYFRQKAEKETLESARTRVKELVLQLKEAKEELALAQKDQANEAEMQKLNSIVRSYEHTLAGIRDKLSTTGSRTRGARGDLHSSSDETESDDPGRAGLLATRDRTEKLLQEAMTRRNSLMSSVGTSDRIRALQLRITDCVRSLEATKRDYPQLAAWADSLLTPKSTSATPTANKMPVTVYVMTDGKEIRAVNVVTMGDQLAIKDENGKILTIDRKNVAEVKKEGSEQPEGDSKNP
jgi:DNA repair exonuclease SbcCD ATPase subunit